MKFILPMLCLYFGLAVFSASILAGENNNSTSMIRETNREGSSTKIDSLLHRQKPKISAGKSLSLKNAFELAAKKNLNLAQTRKEIEIARAELKTAWGRILPIGGSNLAYTINDHADEAKMAGGQAVEVRTRYNLRGNIQINLPLVNAQAWQGINLGKINLNIREINLKMAKQVLYLSVAQTYFSALTLLGFIQIQENQIDTIGKHLKIANLRHRSGTGSLVDVLRIQTDLATAHEELIKSHFSLDNVRDVLAQLVGIKGLPLPTAPPEISLPEKWTEKETNYKKIAENQRYNLKIANKMVTLANQQLTVSWMQFVPTLNASWQLSYLFSEPTTFGSQDRSRWLLGITLSIPLFNHTFYADLDKKRAQLGKATLQAIDTRRKIGLELRKTTRKYKNSIEELELARTKSHLAQKALKLAETAYEHGTGSSLSVTDTRRMSRQAEISLAIKCYNSQLTLLELIYSIGNDIEAIGDNH